MIAASLIALAATTGLVVSSPSVSAAPDVAGASAEGEQVRLITGDRVVLDGQGEVTGLIRAEGREDIPVQVREIGGATFVVPADARPLIADGTLDRRLFDVTELSREQYDTARELPITVTYEDRAEPDETRAELFSDTAAGERPEVDADLPAINGQALTVGSDQAAATWQALTRPADGAEPLAAAPGIAAIALDGVVEATLDESVPQIGAPAAWDAGFDGEGVTIAVLDTGITTQHEDVSPKVVAAENFSDSPDTEDRHGHGTHVASIAAGTGAHSDGTYTGVAPGAQLLNGKVLNDDGFGDESGIIQGMQWAVDQGADIVNLSLGGPADSEIGPMEEAVNTLSADSDALFVIAAGNDGPGEGTVGSPGTADAALTVGAVDTSDQLAEFSSTGPRPRDGAVKPDVTAPGVAIGAAAAPGSAMAEEGTPVADGYVALDGTSMAAPHTAGAAALLAQQHPDWDGERIKAVLTASAQPGDHTAYQQGSGRIDVAAALDQTIVTDQGSLNFGLAEYPHDDNEPVTRELTYRNLGTQDATLQLEAAGTDPNGEPAPAGMFTLATDQVSVPAGGTATVEVTADTTLPRLNGTFDVVVTATGVDAGRTVHTPGVVRREGASYDVTFEAIDRDGRPAENLVLELQDLDTGWRGELGPEGGTLRVPEGDYTLDAIFYVWSDDGSEMLGLDWIAQPDLKVTEETTITLDARETRPIDVSVAVPDAQRFDLAVSRYLSRNRSGGAPEALTGWALGGMPEGINTLQIGDAPEGWSMGSDMNAGFNVGDQRYFVTDQRDGELYSGLTKHVAEDAFARLAVGQGATTENGSGVTFVAPPYQTFIMGIDHALPRTADIFVEAAAADWRVQLQERDATGLAAAAYATPFTSFEPGGEYELTMNTGVFGPRFDGPLDGLFRDGDRIHGRINPLTDGAGNAPDPFLVEVAPTGSTTLYRNGEEYATADDVVDWVEFEVPADKADYELVTTVNRENTGALMSTEVTASYTFTSARPDGEGPVALPATAVRFAPELALDATSPAGETVTIPVTVQGSAAENADALTISVSTDGGETWTDAPVADGTFTVDNPPAGGSVSLRAEIEDGQGNTTTQTIIDAYRTA
ncbi:S8 family serine peptidase [Streptomyces sp. B6B3]|uniref:S8 family serine peptidase n=1 Tax=Streptomyces sp. B6B3 TaxID=3153570 RepID=UPI00325DDF48